MWLRAGIVVFVRHNAKKTKSILLLAVLAFCAGHDRPALGQTGGRNLPAPRESAWRSAAPSDRARETRNPQASRSAEPGVVMPLPEVSGTRRVRMQGSLLLVDDAHMLPRAIEYQGEPLSFLKDLGFNTVWVTNQPGYEILREAGQLGLWMICPPPVTISQVRGERVFSLGAIGPEHDCVLAWDLGHDLRGAQLDDVKRWAKQVRAADRGRRPLICNSQTDLRSFSHHVDVLLLGRSPLLGSLELADYGKWIRTRPWLASPGKSIWTSVQTQPALSLLEQWRALGGYGLTSAPTGRELTPLTGLSGSAGVSRGNSPPLSISSEQISLLAFTAVTSGSRGIVFESHSPLDADDPDTRYRATTLQLLNLELSLAEPWLAAGDSVAPVKGSETEAIGAVLRTDKAQLLVPMWTAPGAQFVCGQSAGNRVSFIVPGVPEEYRALQLVPGGLPPVAWAAKCTTGTRITLDELGVTSLVMLTSEPRWVDRLTGLAERIGRRGAELRRRLADQRLAAVGQVLAKMPGGALAEFDSAGLDDRSPRDRLYEARKNLQLCNGSLASGDHAAAWLHAERAMRPVRLLEREIWDAAVRRVESPVTTPVSVSFWTLPMHWELLARIGGSRLGPNRLAGGEFEEPGTWHSKGWEPILPSLDGVFSEAELSPAAARSGKLGLRISAFPSDIEKPVSLVEAPPAWIRTPPIAVERHALMVIHGWVNVPRPITGSVDGLMIIESLGAEPLAQRIGQTDGWQEFTLYRVAPQSGHLAVEFALSGIGEAWIDDVTVQSVDPGGPLASRPERFRPPTPGPGNLSGPR